MDPGRTVALILLAVSPELSGQTLRFVADSDYPPITSLKDGRPTGLYVDLARAVADELKQPCSVEVEEWTKAQNEVAEGTADVLYSVSYTKERAQRFDFTVPVTRNEFTFFARDGRRGLDNLEDLAGLHVGVTQGGLPRRLIEALPNVTLTPFASYQDAFDALEAGTIDTFAADLWVGSYTLNRERRLGMGPSRHMFASLPAGFGVKKGNVDLLDRLNRAVAKLQLAGTIDKIVNRWDPEAVVIQTKGQISSAVLVTTVSIMGAALVLMTAWVLLLTRENRQRRAAERGKEALLRELHHRTRNNMGVISALLELQSLGGDPKFASAIQLTQNQIFSMALVHEKLYQTQDLSRVHMSAYVKELAEHLASSYGLDSDRMTIKLAVDDVEILIDAAVPLGLILSELIGNAIRHAFPPPRQGEIAVSLARSSEGVEVIVADTGVGFPAGFDARNNGGLGLQTVIKLAEEQLKATVEFGSTRGVRVRLVFQDRYYDERVHR